MRARIRRGEALPDFTLAGLAGAPLRLLDAPAPLVVAVGHGGCHTSRLALPFVDRLAARRGRGAVVAVLQDEPAAARVLVAELGLKLPVQLEADPYPFAAALGLVTVPTLLLIGPDGTVADVVEGFDREALAALDRDLGGDGALFTDEDSVPGFRPG